MTAPHTVWVPPALNEAGRLRHVMQVAVATLKQSKHDVSYAHQRAQALKVLQDGLEPRLEFERNGKAYVAVAERKAGDCAACYFDGDHVGCAYACEVASCSKEGIVWKAK